MAKNKGKNELERLRSEAASLQQGEESPATADQLATTAAENNMTDTGEDHDLNSRLEELVEVLEQELKDTSPITLLIVFALGILIGRLLPR
ncbi:MAG: hypothetical protein ABFS19_14585 [Thermodesulfobacteriota bacterium]